MKIGHRKEFPKLKFQGRSVINHITFISDGCSSGCVLLDILWRWSPFRSGVRRKEHSYCWRKMVLVLSRAWDKEKNLRPHEESNLIAPMLYH